MAATIAKVLVSSFARFVQGDIKGGDAAHAYRKEIIANAVEQAFKGNYSPITEAQTLTEGKAKKARAYAAGFAALGPIGATNDNGIGVVKVAYKGALNANDNKEARELIASQTQQYVTRFFNYFDSVMMEKAEPKTKKAPVAEASPEQVAAANADTVRHDAAVALDQSVTVMEGFLRTGALTGEQTDRIAEALVAGMDSKSLAATLSSTNIVAVADALIVNMHRDQLANLMTTIQAEIELRDLLKAAPVGAVVNEAATV